MSNINLNNSQITDKENCTKGMIKQINLSLVTKINKKEEILKENL